VLLAAAETRAALGAPADHAAARDGVSVDGRVYFLREQYLLDRGNLLRLVRPENKEADVHETTKEGGREGSRSASSGAGALVRGGYGSGSQSC